MKFFLLSLGVALLCLASAENTNLAEDEIQKAFDKEVDPNAAEKVEGEELENFQGQSLSDEEDDLGQTEQFLSDEEDLAQSETDPEYDEFLKAHPHIAADVAKNDEDAKNDVDKRGLRRYMRNLRVCKYRKGYYCWKRFIRGVCWRSTRCVTCRRRLRLCKRRPKQNCTSCVNVCGKHCLFKYILDFKSFNYCFHSLKKQCHYHACFGTCYYPCRRRCINKYVLCYKKCRRYGFF